MSDSSQIALIRKLYDAMGDVNAFKSLLADDVEWDIAEGFPNGGVYRGLDTTFSGFFPFLADFDELYAKGDEYFESGDRVIVLGHYFGVTKKGRRVQARFAHFWTLRDGKVGPCSRPPTPFSSHKLWENDRSATDAAPWSTSERRRRIIVVSRAEPVAPARSSLRQHRIRRPARAWSRHWHSVRRSAASVWH